MTLLCFGQGQLLYLAYNDYGASEGVLLRALQIEPGHLLARMHVDLVRSLRRATALAPYQLLPPSVPYAQAAAADMDDGALYAVCSKPCSLPRPSLAWRHPLARTPARSGKRLDAEMPVLAPCSCAATWHS